MDDAKLDQRVGHAIRHFWQTRNRQQSEQKRAGRVDQGSRGAATGDAQMDGFIGLLQDIILEAGIADSCIHSKSSVELPGFYRPTKKWDLLVVDRGHLIAALEAKSHVGPSFGNNFNNRVEEALGSALDIWTAFREGKFDQPQEPWLGWMLLLEDCEESQTPVSVNEPHFEVFPEFKNASYVERYKVFCRKLVLERRYRAASLVLSDQGSAVSGAYSEPSPESSFQVFARSLAAHLWSR